MEDLKLLELEIHNVRGVRHVHIFGKQINEIAGANHQGKSSVLESIDMLFCGKKATGDKPLRDGEEDGYIRGKVGSGEEDVVFVATRTFTAKKNELKITSMDGVKRGQDQLDRLINKKTIDPLLLMRAKPEERLEQIRSLIPEETITELNKLEGEIQVAEDERKDAKKSLAKIGAISKVEKIEEVDVSELMGEMQENEKHNSAQRAIGQSFKDAANIQGNLDQKITELQKQYDEITAKLEAMPSPHPFINLDAIATKIKQAGETNKAAQQYKQYLAQVEEKAKRAQAVNELEEKVRALHDNRKELKDGIELPVDGLVIDAGDLRLGNIPFGELSTSEKMDLCTILSMNLNPALRIIRIQDGSLLDQDSYRRMVNLILERGYQAWIETVGGGHGDALILKAGEVLEGKALEEFFKGLQPQAPETPKALEETEAF